MKMKLNQIKTSNNLVKRQDDIKAKKKSKEKKQ